MTISRRDFLRKSTLCLGAAASPHILTAPVRRTPPRRQFGSAKKVMVLGMDGVDPTLLRLWVDAGHLPAFKRFMEMGHFGTLRTTMPPQSPVAWSSFITGTNPGGTGIYDFVHRDPSSFTPYMSTSRSFDAPDALSLGGWQIPLSSGRVDLMRKGRPIWSILEEHGIPTTVFQIPANFPVVESDTHAVSGMGTPDLLGTYGTFTYFTEEVVPNADRIAGGRVVRIFPFNHAVETKLVGPSNPFRAKHTDAEIGVSFTRDPHEAVVRIALQNHQIILKAGEWSEWIPISFELIPFFAAIGGMVRFYVKDVHPQLKIYCSPINVDPMNPALPICSPASYSQEVSSAVGRFYTQGFPSDSKVLSAGIFTDDEYLQQAKIVMDECSRTYLHQLERFQEGFFFFYFSSIDQNSHMLWRTMDPTHPLYNPNASDEVKGGLLYFYKKMDWALDQALAKLDSNTDLFIVSDHGFAPFTREFHLSTWLVKEGFTVLTDPTKLGKGEFYDYVDWKRTRAYALGINGIYVNLEGREKWGSVKPDAVQSIKDEIRARLVTVTDPQNGSPVVTTAYDGATLYQGPFASFAPDVVVGYNRGYRISDESVLGKFPKELVGDRKDKWAADHCADSSFLSGVLLSNRPWQHPSPGLWDMAPTILASFGIPTPPEMEGRAIYS